MTAQPSITPRPIPREVLVTPALASEWLKRNINNRPLSQANVGGLADDILNGRWVDNGETVKLDWNGNLIDGQHRLTAVVRAGVAVTMLVVEGLDPRSQMTVDVGRPRSVGQQLELSGVPQGARMAAVGAALWRYKKYPHLVWTGGMNLSKAGQMEWTTRHLGAIRVGVLTGVAAHRATGVPQTAYGAVAALALLEGLDDEFTAFHEGFVTGANLPDGDPRLALRRWSTQRRPKGNWDTQMTMGVTIKAYNAWGAGRTGKVMTFRRDELPMPKLATP
jgi:hypothetical protein